jgi:hypothetical protein
LGSHRKHYGADGDPLILVAQGTSRDFNPSLPQSVVDRALERDHAAASAEYLAQFRTDIETYISFEIVQACIGDHNEMAPLPNPTYHAFVDPSGGSADSFTLAISHRDGEQIVIDATREIKPPFSPEGVIEDFAVLLKSYRIARVVGDRYAGEFCREGFRKKGIHYVCAAKPKSDLFRDLLCCRCSIPGESSCSNPTGSLINSPALNGAPRVRARTASTTVSAVMMTSPMPSPVPPTASSPPSATHTRKRRLAFMAHPMIRRAVWN